MTTRPVNDSTDTLLESGGRIYPGPFAIMTVWNNVIIPRFKEAFKIPCPCFAGVFVLLAVFFKFLHPLNFTNLNEINQGAGALKHPHTMLGMLAISMYAGGEMTRVCNHQLSWIAEAWRIKA